MSVDVSSYHVNYLNLSPAVMLLCGIPCIEYGFYEEALSLFSKMRIEGIREDERTIVIMLSVCEDLADGLRNGKSLHALARKSGMKTDASLGNTLLSMYAEFNCVESVQKAFSEMKYSDVISWNTQGTSLQWIAR